MKAWHNYYLLTKPGIIRGNLLTTLAGFLLASAGDVNIARLFITLFAVALIIASGCVLNNFMDREIDKKMQRTNGRPSANGSITLRRGLVYGTLLGLAGFSLLVIYINWLTVAVGLLGYLDYLFVYGLAKRNGPLGTLVGSVSGAVPPVAGYTAVTGHIDLTAGLLFLILICWQMPHFYAIAIYRLKDYKAAGLPVLPAVRGIRQTKQQILAYILSYILAVMWLGLAGKGSPLYLVLVGGVLIGLAWLGFGLSRLNRLQAETWAKQMFRVSLLALSTLCFFISVDSFI